MNIAKPIRKLMGEIVINAYADVLFAVLGDLSKNIAIRQTISNMIIIPAI